jgi:putative membrane-bound dehydrogenase-like protein
MLDPSATAITPPRATTLPACPPDWKLEVVATAPAVRHPSVVCCAPDGRVFVAEDPMDISAPHADLPLGRILCLHPDGKVTVFADKLFAVFGLQYLDGMLYVLHNPKLSRFRDDRGIGRDRVDLIERTNPNPWALDWNDHVPANFRLAMDGFLYMAVGDKGLYGAVGRDGKRVDLHGGGILRLRPDGTQLEVFSRGVRNILDVAIDGEDELFTYDNTDEMQWMSRLTHMVEGGFYGYPYDFIPRRPYTLWMMADYGGGAATGALAYTEDALPPEYHGNLFLADFGKRQLLRVQVERRGATFEAVSRQDFFTDPPGDFRPVGITLAPDGMSVYLCDWNHLDTKENVSVGRLLRLAYTGPSRAAAKPAWYLPAAAGKPFAARDAELLQGLAHPARSVRLVAQRRLAERGQRVVPALVDLLSDRRARPHARWHVLWALDAVDDGRSARPAILAAARDTDASVRRQAVRQLGTRRVREAMELLAALLTDTDAGVRFQAATALGRIGDRAAVPALLRALQGMDLFARFAVFTALNRTGRADALAWPAIVGGLEHPHAAVRDGSRWALRETYEEPLVDALIHLAQDPARSTPGRVAALELLAAVHRQQPAWKGEWWAYHPVNAPPPARTVAWKATERILNQLRRCVADDSPAVRRAAVDGLRTAADAASAQLLRERFRAETDPEVRRGLVEALGALGDREFAGLLRKILENPKEHAGLLREAVLAAEQIGGEDVAVGLMALIGREPLGRAVLLQTLHALGTLKAPTAVPVLKAKVQTKNSDVRRAALEALVRIGGKPALEALRDVAKDRSPEIRLDAVAALGDLKSAAAVPDLLNAYQAAQTRDAALTALTHCPDVRALDPYLAGLAGRNAELRAQCQEALARIRDEALPGIEARADRLAPEVVARLQQLYRQSDTARRGKLFARAVATPAPAAYLEFVRKNTGDAARGRTLFHDPTGLGCVRCHRVQGQGGDIGPDLSTAGAQFSRVQLAEAVLYPSKSIREGYTQIQVTTRDGRFIAGLVRAESPDALTLRDATGKDHTLRKTEIEERHTSGVSLMPEGLQTGLPLESFADLVSFLESLKGTRPERGMTAPGSD